MAVKAIPEDYPRVMPYLAIDGASDAIAFYRTVLGATERMRMGAPGDKVGHAELDLGDSVIMLADIFPESGNKAPKTLGGTPVTLMVYVEDVDGVLKTAIDNGATEVQAPADQFYGDRTAAFEDPWGHRWHIATHIEDLTEEEMGKRAAAAMG